MPWRLLGLAFFLVIVAVFIGFNLDNKADISLGFVQFEQVHVFYAMFIAYLLGVLTTIPLAFVRRLRPPGRGGDTRRKNGKGEEALPAPATITGEDEISAPAEEKPGLLGRGKKKKRKGKAATRSEADEPTP